MERVLKIGASLLVAVVVLTLFTVRLTGLEPQFLEVKDLPAHHMIARPGLWLRGGLVTTPVTDWSFVGRLPHPGQESNTILVETSTPYLIPHSVRVVPLVRDGQLYIRSHHDRMTLAGVSSNGGHNRSGCSRQTASLPHAAEACVIPRFGYDFSRKESGSPRTSGLLAHAADPLTPKRSLCERTVCPS